MRAAYTQVGQRLGGPARTVASVETLSAPGPAGPIPLRLYRPLGSSEGLQPGSIYVHGGGWVMGDLDTHDKVCRRLAATCALVVVAVDYRLAPEHPFPAGPDDVIAATRWILANAKDLGLDPARIGIAGDSAGGSLAAVASLATRDATGSPLSFQVLIYPGTNNTADAESAPSRIAQADTPPMSSDAMKAMIASYLPDPEQAYDWRASPLLAQDHAGLPPALVITGGFDPLRDEGIAYATRLANCGVDVLHGHYAGQIHGFIEMGGVLDAVEDAMQTIAFWVARNTHR
ncbi:MAG: alpha/beta hydrolase [Janthinobacterium lividum]